MTHPNQIMFGGVSKIFFFGSPHLQAINLTFEPGTPQSGEPPMVHKASHDLGLSS